MNGLTERMSRESKNMNGAEPAETSNNDTATISPILPRQPGSFRYVRILIGGDSLCRNALRLHGERLFPGTMIVEASSFSEVLQLGEKAQLPATLSESHIAVVPGTAATADVRAVIQAAAAGLIPENATGTNLVQALELLLARATSVLADVLFADNRSETPTREGTAPWVSALTNREHEVLRGVARGLSNKEIGRELEMAEVTVKCYLRKIFRKLGARTRSQAAVIATKASLA